MKWQAEVDGHEHEIEWGGRQADRLEASIDGRTVVVELQELRPGLLLALAGGRSFEIAARRTGEGEYELAVNGRTRSVRLRDPRRQAPLQAEAADGPREVRAPMPGRVVKTLANKGDLIQSGQGLLVVEAMKMQNEVQSPCAGRVAALDVASGDSVGKGQLLAVIEPAPQEE